MINMHNNRRNRRRGDASDVVGLRSEITVNLTLIQEPPPHVLKHMRHTPFDDDEEWGNHCRLLDTVMHDLEPEMHRRMQVPTTAVTLGNGIVRIRFKAVWPPIEPLTMWRMSEKESQTATGKQLMRLILEENRVLGSLLNEKVKEAVPLRGNNYPIGDGVVSGDYWGDTTPWDELPVLSSRSMLYFAGGLLSFLMQVPCARPELQNVGVGGGRSWLDVSPPKGQWWQAIVR